MSILGYGIIKKNRGVKVTMVTQLGGLEQVFCYHQGAKSAKIHDTFHIMF